MAKVATTISPEKMAEVAISPEAFFGGDSNLSAFSSER
jgi:hypothetical protein